MNAPKQERILCAAVYYDDGKKRIHKPRNIETGIVVTGLRHCNCFETLAEIFTKREYVSGGLSKQGFLTSANRFVNRVEAGIIALKANQINKPFREGTELYSEDLY